MDYNFEAKEVVEQGRTSQKAIDSIKLWMKDEDLPTIPDQMVVIFLLSCNNQLEFTKKTIRAYYKCMKNSPELFDDRIVERKDLQLACTTV